MILVHLNFGVIMVLRIKSYINFMTVSVNWALVM